MGAAPSLRDTLSGAFDKAEAAEEPEAPAAEPGPVEEPATTPEPAAEDAATPEPNAEQDKAAAAARARNEDGTFAKAPKKPAAKGKEAKPAAAPEKAPKGKEGSPPPVLEAPGAKAPAASTATAAAAPGDGDPALKPPQSWKPLAREKWSGLPKEVQQEVLRVDGEVRQVMQRAAGTQRSLQQHQEALGRVSETLAPYEAMIRAEGAEPLAAVGSLLQTAHALRTAPLPQRAAIVANIIKNHGVPIDVLADVLDGKAPAGGQAAPTAPPQVIDPAAIERAVLAKVEQQAQQREVARQQQEAHGAVETFLADKEFGDIVRDTMADLQEVYARSNRHLSLEDAYKLATQYHPEVAPVLKQRADAEAAKAKAASTQRARAASSSVKSQPTGAPPPAKATGLRATLEAAFSEAEGG